MSDSEEAPPAAATPAAPKATTSKAVLALLVLNLGGTGFGVFKVMTASANDAHAAVKPEEPKTQEVTGPIVALDPFVTNLDETGSARYLKVTLQLEVMNHEGEESLTKSKQVIRDVILSHLSGLKLKDTLGAEAKESLRKQLMAKMEPIVGAGKIRRMFFQEFVVQ
jgi:flagellar FliL protein